MYQLFDYDLDLSFVFTRFLIIFEGLAHCCVVMIQPAPKQTFRHCFAMLLSQMIFLRRNSATHPKQTPTVHFQGTVQVPLQDQAFFKRCEMYISKNRVWNFIQYCRNFNEFSLAKSLFWPSPFLLFWFVYACSSEISTSGFFPPYSELNWNCLPAGCGIWLLVGCVEA